MNNEDMSEIIQKLSSMMNNSNNNDTSSNKTSCDNSNSQISNMNFNFNDNNDTSNNTSFNFDFETIMRIKNIMDTINSNKNSADSNLLMSLKPYLNINRRKKVDQYIQFLNIAKVIESFNTGNNEVTNK